VRRTERELLELVLLKIANSCDLLPEENLTAFSGLRGNKSNDTLMIIGRAVNGWTNDWLPAELKDQSRRTEILTDLFETNAGGTVGSGCPMNWVSEQWQAAEGYNTKRSPFWRSTRTLLTRLGISDEGAPDWPSSLEWTNLYKVAPSNGGNPSSRLCSVQHSLCRELLQLEIRNSKARRILFLTGLDWAYPFLPRLSNVVFADSFDKYVALRGDVRFDAEAPLSLVVASHPQGKRESLWVDQVANAFVAQAALDAQKENDWVP